MTQELLYQLVYSSNVSNSRDCDKLKLAPTTQSRSPGEENQDATACVIMQDLRMCLAGN